jgi:ABC-2 type transport system permease protein
VSGRAAKYFAFARIAMAQARRERGELYGRVVFFFVILGVFTALWRAIAEAGLPVSGQPADLVWYLASTEWILLSAPLVHVEIQETIRRGDVIYELGRPISYVAAAVAQGLGILLVRAPVLAAAAGIGAFLFTGSFPPGHALLSVCLFGLVAAALLTSLHVGIGLLAFWLNDVSAVYWVWQKLLFILGGLILPLEIYPGPMQAAASFTPFPVILAGPASFVLVGTDASPVTLAQWLLFWSAMTAAGITWIFRRATAGVTIHGG